MKERLAADPEEWEQYSPWPLDASVEFAARLSFTCILITSLVREKIFRTGEEIETFKCHQKEFPKMILSKRGETYPKTFHYQTSEEVVSFSSVLGIDKLPELR